jgi:hypothetical protein
MGNYGTIKIPEPAYEYHNERRQEMGVTWEQYINDNAPERDVGPVTLEASEYARIADEVEGRMR